MIPLPLPPIDERPHLGDDWVWIGNKEPIIYSESRNTAIIVDQQTGYVYVRQCCIDHNGELVAISGGGLVLSYDSVLYPLLRSCGMVPSNTAIDQGWT